MDDDILRRIMDAAGDIGETDQTHASAVTMGRQLVALRSGLVAGGLSEHLADVIVVDQWRLALIAQLWPSSPPPLGGIGHGRE